MPTMIESIHATAGSGSVSLARGVRISGWPAVMSTMCSKWALGLPSMVTAVQLSASVRVLPRPMLIIGSIASTMPALSFIRMSGSAQFGICGSS